MPPTTHKVIDKILENEKKSPKKISNKKLHVIKVESPKRDSVKMSKSFL